MRVQNQLQKTSQWPVILAFILIGINLRPSMAAIGPLLSHIQITIPASYTLISLLTMLPILVMGLVMFCGVKYIAKIGEHTAIAGALVMIGLSSLARLYANDIMDLILTAIVAGLGIAIIQAIMPGIIKSHFPRSVPFYMGIYITAIMAGAALAAALAPYVVSYSGSWRWGLAIWSGLAAFALAAWFAIRQEMSTGSDAHSMHLNTESFMRTPRAWLLGVFFGLNTALYTCVLAWLPPYYMEHGWQEGHAGLLLAYLTGMEVIAGLTIPMLASYSMDRRWVLFGLLFLIFSGFAGLLWVPEYHALIWASLLGLGIGGLFPMSLIVAMDHLDSPQRAGPLAAFVQGIGYLIAAFSPLIAGTIRDVFSSFDLAWILLMFITLNMFWMVSRFNPLNYARCFKRVT